MEYKSIKLSQQEYDLLKRARKMLIHCGIKTLPKSLQDRIESLLKNGELSLGKMVGIVAITLDYSVNRG